VHKNRPEIDGLRAIAIVPVVLYHAGIKQFSGGFIGVDVFFVISGFLITSIIYSDVQKGRFSIAAFYERRIRRIIPALSAMLVFCIAVSFLVLMPGAFREFGRSVSTATLFVSNVLFARQTGYFDLAAEEKPLLHTWSLAVEEQFYIFYPIFLFLMYKYLRKYLAASTTAVLLVSFAVGLWGVKHEPTASFYLAPTRAWELMLGALLAFGVVPVVTRRPVNNVLSLLGAAMIAWGVFRISSQTLFPGANALFPCLGSALIIYACGPASGGTLVGTVLSTWPFRMTGLISYSLYLWHWPLLIFAKYYAIRPMTALETLGVVSLAVVISVLSWRYVEQPFRGKGGAFSRKTVFAGAGVLMLFFLAAGIAIDRSNGLPSRLPSMVISTTETADALSFRARCSNPSLDRIRRDGLCRIGAGPDSLPSFILWGDSHALAMVPGIEQLAAKSNRIGLFAVRTACPPLLGVYRLGEAECLEFNDEVLKLVQRTRSIRTVLLVARWALSAEGERFENEPGETVYIGDRASKERSVAEDSRVFARGLDRTVARLTRTGLRVVVMAQVPEVGYHVRLTLAKMTLFGKSLDLRPRRADYMNRQRHVLAEIAHLVKAYGVRAVYPQKLLCGPIVCEIKANGHLLYFDDDHVSNFGSRYVAQLLQPAFKGHD
jgi:peptidoglycan/LPS O-acetylase OafA/YrhL